MFWNATPCSLVEVHWRFSGTYCLHVLDLSVNLASSVSLLFGPGDESSTLLQRARSHIQKDIYILRHESLEFS
jgi:hypothetical protein